MIPSGWHYAIWYNIHIIDLEVVHYNYSIDTLYQFFFSLQVVIEVFLVKFYF